MSHFGESFLPRMWETIPHEEDNSLVDVAE
jgi:hypothetical protein